MLKHTTHTHIHVHMLTRTFTLSRAFSLLTHTHAFIHLCTYTTISLYLCLFSCPTPSFSQTATYRHALKHLAKMCCQCFSSLCHSGHAPKWPPRLRSLFLSLPSFHSPFQSQAHAYIPVAVYVPQKPTFNDSAHSHFYSPASPSLLAWGGDCKRQLCKIKRKCFTL